MARKHAHKSSRHGKDQPRPSGGLRPFWSGTITFGLVSVPVDVYSALRNNRIALRMLDEDGTPLRRRYYCPEHNVDVHPEHIVRGYEVAGGQHVIVRDDELEALAPSKSRDIDLSRFVDRGQIPPSYFQRSYFLAPAGESTKAYRLLAEVMERTGRAGLASFVMRGKEYLVVILAEGGILQAETMRFQDELRTPEDVGLPEPLEPPKRDVTGFEKAIEQLTRADLPQEVLRDTGTDQLRSLVEQKRRAGRDVLRAPEVEDEEDEEAQAESLDDTEEEEAGPAGVDLLAKIRERLRGGSPHAPIHKARGEAKQEPRGQVKAKPRGEADADRHGRRRTAKAKPAGDGDLNGLSKEELYRRAAEQGIAGRSKMNKQQLIRSLKQSA